MSLSKKEGHIRAYCYKFKNRNRMFTATIDKGKQPKNNGEASVVENRQIERKLRVISTIIPNFLKIGFLTQLVRFIFVPTRAFQEVL